MSKNMEKKQNVMCWIDATPQQSSGKELETGLVAKCLVRRNCTSLTSSAIVTIVSLLRSSPIVGYGATPTMATQTPMDISSPSPTALWPRSGSRAVPHNSSGRSARHWTLWRGPAPPAAHCETRDSWGGDKWSSELADGWPESVEEQGLLLLVLRHYITRQYIKDV